ncbi:TPA: multidrug ABC transporter ATP-binding protein [bacterium]|nr:multidrug ABC transporter ATP-binding protein [bacterium]
MIRISGLSKEYGPLKAVDNLNLEIKEAEIFGLLGPNGAGKTTVIQMLNTLTWPTSGRAEIGGFDLVSEANKVKWLIGVSPQEMNLDRELTARENLRIHGLMYRTKAIDQRINELLSWAELNNQADVLVKTYSGGMKRRLLIVRAIMHRPKVLFLDEPTVGLDPQIRRQIWDLIRNLNQDGTTILFTTHYIEEAELLCHRVGILSHGRLITLGTPQELRNQVGQFVVESMDDGVTNYRLFDTREQAYRFAEERADDVVIRESNLEDVFIKLTGERIER